MVSRKLKHFEYAGQDEAGPSGDLAIHQQKSFETPNGYVLVMSSCDSPRQAAAQQTATVLERVKYYLDNEVLDDPTQAVQNALLYANGYLFEQQRKQDEQPLPVSCLCLLIQEQTVYYSWAGDVNMFLFADKKWIPMVQASGEFLGIQKMIVPGVCDQPVQPVDDDLILIGTGPVNELASGKHARKVLLDNMPAQTKVVRLVKILKDSDHQRALALQLVRFYNMGHQQRTFVPSSHEPAPSVAAGKLVQDILQLPGRNNVVKTALAVIAFILIGYMVYDLFFSDAQPVARVVSPEETSKEQKDSATVEMNPAVQVAQPELPADVQYTVRSGDTWGKIYGQYEVCSWFIRNHPPNSSLFENTNDPVVGTRLMIPVAYSADSSLNPEYYQEFTTDKVGSSCQNAGTQFLEEFEEEILR
ncbi:MAG: hypothetical protein R6U64_10800 [Bacteroidales bacterium]